MAVRSVVEHPSLRAQVGQLLRARVASGELQPDQIYSAVALAEEMGVSATPVREAMLDLAAAGLVESVRNRGFRILTVSDDDLDEIVAMRLWLEVPAVEEVIARASDAELELLRPLAADIVDAASSRQPAAFLIADKAFHRELLALTGNRRLWRAVEELRDQTQLLGIERLGRSGQLDLTAAEHHQLLELLLARDVERARALMASHLRHTRGVWAGTETGELTAASPASSADATP